MRGKIAITGATGHLGSVLCARLQARGVSPVLVVRDRAKLDAMGWINSHLCEVREADARDKIAMQQALLGCDRLYHAAALFDVTHPDPLALISANVQAVEATLRAAASCELRKVVLTSSVAAVGTSSDTSHPRSEADWNLASPEPYAKSKALAEKRAWSLSAEFGLELITVLPGAMLGPGFVRPTPTLRLVEAILTGKMPIVPPFDFTFADVRDVADAHIALMDAPQASGRYIAAGKVLTAVQLAARMTCIRTSIKTPKEMSPNLARILALVDGLVSRVFATPPRMSAGMVAEYAGRTHALRSTRLFDQFGWRSRSIDATLSDTIDWFEGERDLASVVG